jgi:hypothetical protein
MEMHNGYIYVLLWMHTGYIYVDLSMCVCVCVLLSDFIKTYLFIFKNAL